MTMPDISNEISKAISLRGELTSQRCPHISVRIRQHKTRRKKEVTADEI